MTTDAISVFAAVCLVACEARAELRAADVVVELCGTPLSLRPRLVKRLSLAARVIAPVNKSDGAGAQTGRMTPSCPVYAANDMCVARGRHTRYPQRAIHRSRTRATVTERTAPSCLDGPKPREPEPNVRSIPWRVCAATSWARQLHSAGAMRTTHSTLVHSGARALRFLALGCAFSMPSVACMDMELATESDDELTDVGGKADILPLPEVRLTAAVEATKDAVAVVLRNASLDRAVFCPSVTVGVTTTVLGECPGYSSGHSLTLRNVEFEPGAQLVRAGDSALGRPELQQLTTDHQTATGTDEELQYCTAGNTSALNCGFPCTDSAGGTHRYGDTWTERVGAHGSRENTCTATGEAREGLLDCDDGYIPLGNDVCIGQPCGNTPHGREDVRNIPHGVVIGTCQLGEVINERAECEAGWYARGLECVIPRNCGITPHGSTARVEDCDFATNQRKVITQRCVDGAWSHVSTSYPGGPCL